MTDQEALATIEWLCGDDFCEDMSMRQLSDDTDLGMAAKKLAAVYRIAHSLVQSHSCFSAHDDWRQEAQAMCDVSSLPVSATFPKRDTVVG